MRIAKEDIPVKIDAPGAVARQIPNFGDATGYGKIGGEYFSLGEGADLTPLLHGLEDNKCQCPHWGYILKGSLTTIYTSGEEETATEGDLFYWPPGHTVKAGADSDFILFSPQVEHEHVMEHILDKMKG